MKLTRLTAFFGLWAVAAALRLHAYEINAWPAYVLQKDEAGRTVSWEGAGPLVFTEPAPGPEAGTASGLRPFYVRVEQGGIVRTDILYPLFFFRKYPDSYSWSILQLINGQGTDAAPGSGSELAEKRFDLWPFYFSLQTGDPSEGYRALFPVAGTVKGRLGFKQLTWFLFPLYAELHMKGTETRYTPFPFVRTYTGAAHGFAVWPLFGSTKGPGVSSHFYAAWPLFWHNVLEAGPDAPEGTAPSTQLGILPLFTRDAGPDSISENYLWPFFGYTERTAPYRYSERRYFWPFAVQGRGEDHVIERWAPFYAYSSAKGADSTWVAWPLWHQKSWSDSDLGQTKTQFFYFVYWSLEQKSLSRPGLAHAYKRHYWPLLSVWDNGAGSRQIQIPSLTEVFFNDNADVRLAWSPLFSVYRYDHRPSGETRTSVLWSALSWRRGADGQLEEFHLGPVVGMRRAPSGESWTILGFDIGAKPTDSKLPNR